jgi:hypothetical protein
MPELKTLLDLYGLLVADGNMSFSDAIDRLMRTDLDKVQDRLTTQLVNSISRTEAVENQACPNRNKWRESLVSDDLTNLRDWALLLLAAGLGDGQADAFAVELVLFCGSRCRPHLSQ